MTQGVRYNVALKGKDVPDLPVGKVVSYQHPPRPGQNPLPERLIFHAYVKERYRRRDIDAFGLNASLVVFVHETCPMVVRKEDRDGHRIEIPVHNVWLWDSDRNVTYSTFSGLFLAYCLAGEPDPYGGDYNLFRSEWVEHRFQLKTAWATTTRTVPRTVTITKESTRQVPAPQLEPERQPSLIGAMP
jgi:hypothetical protein